MMAATAANAATWRIFSTAMCQRGGGRKVTLRNVAESVSRCPAAGTGAGAAASGGELAGGVGFTRPSKPAGSDRSVARLLQVDDSPPPGCHRPPDSFHRVVANLLDHLLPLGGQHVVDEGLDVAAGLVANVEEQRPGER